MDIRILSVLTVLCVSFTPTARAAGCKLTHWGVDRAIVTSDAGTFEYRLERRHPRWQIDPFAHHADAIIGCEPCASGAIKGGMLWYEAADGTIMHSSRDQDAGFLSFQGAMWFGHGIESPLQDTGEHLVTGWGPFQLSARRFAYRPEGKRAVDVIAVSASDACLNLRLYLSREATTAGSLQDHLVPLLEEIAVSRSTR